MSNTRKTSRRLPEYKLYRCSDWANAVIAEVDENVFGFRFLTVSIADALTQRRGQPSPYICCPTGGSHPYPTSLALKLWFLIQEDVLAIWEGKKPIPLRRLSRRFTCKQWDDDAVEEHWPFVLQLAAKELL
mgnify:CR=1 FL=1